MQHKHFTCTITFKRLKEDFQKKNCGWHSKLTKNNLFIQFNPSQHLNKVKKLNIEVEILTMIYYLKIEHINFLTHQSSVQWFVIPHHESLLSVSTLFCWNYFLSVQAYRGAGVGTLMSGESSCSCGVAGLGCQALILSVSCW